MAMTPTRELQQISIAEVAAVIGCSLPSSANRSWASGSNWRRTRSVASRWRRSSARSAGRTLNTANCPRLRLRSSWAMTWPPCLPGSSPPDCDVEVAALQERFPDCRVDDIRAVGAGAGLVRPRTGRGVVRAKERLVARLSLPIGSDTIAIRGGGVMTSARFRSAIADGPDGEPSSNARTVHMDVFDETKFSQCLEQLPHWRNSGHRNA